MKSADAYPALALLLLPGSARGRKDAALARGLKCLYRTVLPLAIDRPKKAVAGLVIVFVQHPPQALRRHSHHRRYYHVSR